MTQPPYADLERHVPEGDERRARNTRCQHGWERRVCMRCQHRLLRNGRGVYRYRVANGGLRFLLNKTPRVICAAFVVGDFAYCVKWR